MTWWNPQDFGTPKALRDLVKPVVRVRDRTSHKEH